MMAEINLDPISRLSALSGWFSGPEWDGLMAWAAGPEWRPTPSTEFLGDLYQSRCEEARKGRALVQTPDFVRELILGRTLGLYMDRNGPAVARTIDPACGCGHFVVDSFKMIFEFFDIYQYAEIRGMVVDSGMPDPGELGPIGLAQLALDLVVGVDLDPVCVEIARARLVVEAWGASRTRHPFRASVFEGDSLLHHRPMPGDDAAFGPWPYDVGAVRAALTPGRYAAVVGNPPYIVCRDPTRSEAYRARYASCYRQYSLGLPFTEMCFGLAIQGRAAALRAEEKREGKAASSQRFLFDDDEEEAA
jgi:hypothetical protein